MAGRLTAIAVTAAAVASVLLAARDVQRSPVQASENLLKNPGFEENAGPGTIPNGWQVIDANAGYFGWIGPRAERLIGTVGPRTGRYMAGLDLDMLGVDTNEKGDHIARAALFQSLTVPGRSRGTFRVYYNDLESTALAHVSAIRLAYTVNSTDIRSIRFPAVRDPGPLPAEKGPALWSRPFYRVAQSLPQSQTSLGDWSVASIPVEVDSQEDEARLTLWIGIFEHQNSTEVAYYRLDDACFTLDAGE